MFSMKLIIFDIKVEANENEVNLIRIVFIRIIMNITHAIKINFLM